MIYLIVIFKMLLSAGLAFFAIQHDNWVMGIICLVIFADCGISVTANQKPPKDNN